MHTFLPSRVVAVVVSSLVCVMQAHAVTTVPACHAATGPLRGTLVELYTSEGCSSCPPADRWFAGLAANADPAKLSLLAFHVDYWDSLGWPDRFGSGLFSERQHRRVANAGSSAVYTPQVMVDQRVGFPWGSPSALSALRGSGAHPSPLALDLTATPDVDGFEVALKVMPAAASVLPAAALYLALYENGLSTQVKAGENDGVLLRHERVVRQLLGPYPLSGKQWARALQLARPGGARAGQLGVTAFVQSGHGDTLQALSLPLASCGL